MKTPKNYRPKYSLSIAILAKVLSKKELKDLIDRYVIVKKENWGNYRKGK